MIAVVLIILVSALINYMKDLQFRGLQSQLDRQLKCLVVRNGDISQIHNHDVVVGDVCIIKYGQWTAANWLIDSFTDSFID